jgi:hypothetical protein
MRTLLAVLVLLVAQPASANHGDIALYVAEDGSFTIIGQKTNGNPVWTLDVRLLEGLSIVEFQCYVHAPLEFGEEAFCRGGHQLNLGTSQDYPYWLTPLDVHEVVVTLDGRAVPTLAIIAI